MNSTKIKKTIIKILPYIILWIVAPMEPRQITEGTDLKDQ